MTRAYSDFRITIDADADAYRAAVVDSPAGETSRPVRIEWEPPSSTSIPSAPRSSRFQLAPGKVDSETLAFGDTLFSTFFSGAIGELYRESCSYAVARSEGLRLKLQISDPALAALPWELLYDRRNREFPALLSRTPLVRHIPLPRGAEPLDVEPPLRVLGLIAQAGGVALDVSRERELIDAALAGVSKRGLVKFHWLDSGTPEGLRRAEQEGEWHVFHFVGHGDFDVRSGEGFLWLESESADGRQLSGRDLGLLLREGSTRLAVLNSCKGATSATGLHATGTAGALMYSGLGGVVAMQNPITDGAAITFARVFYLALADGQPVEAAVAAARIALRLEHSGSGEWWTPVLHLRADVGTLFQLPEHPPDLTSALEGERYLADDVDDLLARNTRRQRWLRRAVAGWLAAGIIILILASFLSVDSAPVVAEVTAAGIEFRLIERRELFSDAIRLTSLTASGLGSVVPPSSPLPLTPPNPQQAQLRVSGTNAGSAPIFLEPWELPPGATVGLLHQRSTRSTYAVTANAPDLGPLRATIMGEATVALFAPPGAVGDYRPAAPITVYPSDTIELELSLSRPRTKDAPLLPIDLLRLARDTYTEASGWREESTVREAHVRFAKAGGKGWNLGSHEWLHLDGAMGSLQGLHLDTIGVVFTFEGTVDSVAVGGERIPFPSHLTWWWDTRRLQLVAGCVAYLLIVALGLLSMRSP